MSNYETLEEQGRLFVLPCKLGDHVYYIARNKDGKRYIAHAEVWGISAIKYYVGGKIKLYIKYIKPDGAVGRKTTRLGKNVFLSCKQAVQALEGGAD